MPFTWDEEILAFFDEDDRIVPRGEVRGKDESAIDEWAAAIVALLGMLADRFIGRQAEAETDEDGDEAFREWQEDSERAIKTGIVGATSIAAGGDSQATDGDWEIAAAMIVFHLGYWREFVAEVQGGMRLDGEFKARAGMYGGSSVGTFEKVFRAVASDRYTEEMRILSSNRPCDDCIGYASMGWVPIGTLPPIAEACECKSNCRCSFAYRILR
jgi:hypothetical protein